jgi:heterotetrameric sarcosine oxidase gamma subunit
VDDSPEFQSAVLKTYAGATGQLALTDVSNWTKLIVRGATDTAAARQLDVTFGGSRLSGDVLVCAQRPTEWMLMGAAAAAVADVADGLDQNGHLNVIDHTHSRSLFRLTGSAAASVLEKVCSLDWSDAMTPNGAVVSATAAKVNCDITRHDVDGTASYLIASDRSFAQYLFDALLDAGHEFEIGVDVG